MKPRAYITHFQPVDPWPWPHHRTSSVNSSVTWEPNTRLHLNFIALLLRSTCEMFPQRLICLNTWSPVLVVLFWKVEEPLQRRASLKEVGHLGWALRFYRPGLHPVYSLFPSPPRCEEVESPSSTLLPPWLCLLTFFPIHVGLCAFRLWARIKSPSLNLLQIRYLVMATRKVLNATIGLFGPQILRKAP